MVKWGAIGFPRLALIDLLASQRPKRFPFDQQVGTTFALKSGSGFRSMLINVPIASVKEPHHESNSKVVNLLDFAGE